MGGVDAGLASDRRAGWAPRMMVRERHRATLREQWRPLVALVGAVVVLTLLASLLVAPAFARGVVVGTGIASAVAMATGFVVLLAGTGPVMMGELAEQWTAQALRPARADGWRLINHFGLGPGDNDHVLVGARGLLLVETKWSALDWARTEGDALLQRALQQTADNARRLSRWDGVARHGRPQVLPVLVLWGGARHTLGDAIARKHGTGVVVVQGRSLSEWLQQRPSRDLTDEQVEAIWEQIFRHAGRRDAHEQQARPMPRSIAELTVGALGAVVAGVVGFVAVAQVLRHTGSLLGGALAGAVEVVLAEVVRRRTRWTWEARAVQVGVVATVIVAAVAVVGFYLKAWL